MYERGYEVSAETSDHSIVDKIVAGKTTAYDPQFIVIGGGIQTGQAILHKMMIDEKFIEAETTAIITPAHFVAMDGFSRLQHLQHPEKHPALVENYRKIVDSAVERAINEGLSILLVDHAENAGFILALHAKCKTAGYNTLLIGMTSAPQSCFDYANYTEKTQQREADHPRAFRFLRDFTANYASYAEAFDATALFESTFSLKAGEPEMAVRQIAETRRGRDIRYVQKIHDQQAFAQFCAHSQIKADATTPSAAAGHNAPCPPKFEDLKHQLPVDVPLDYFGRRTKLTRLFNQFAAKNITTRTAAQFKKIIAKRTAEPKSGG
jgi:hypothetical protein